MWFCKTDVDHLSFHQINSPTTLLYQAANVINRHILFNVIIANSLETLQERFFAYWLMIRHH